MIQKFKLHPRKLFLVDSLGALLTAFLLGIVLTRFTEEMGIPEKMLYPLCIIALVYVVYSMVCFFLIGKNWRPFLQVIAIANIFYCLLTMGCVFFFFETITIWGWVYFGGEFMVIGSLVYVELSVASMVYLKKS